MSRYDTRPSFEATIARLHIIEFITRLGAAATGTIVIAVPTSSEAELWLSPALNYFRKIRDAAVKAMAELVFEDVEHIGDNQRQPYDAAMLTSNGLTSGFSGAKCMLNITEMGHEDLKHPSVRLADELVYMHLDPTLVIKAAAEHGRAVTVEEAELLIAMPHRYRHMALTSSRAIRESHTLHFEVMEKEAELKAQEGAKESKKTAAPVRCVPDVRPLDELHGYGDAKLWGLELARDVADWERGDIGWSDVDNGVLLSGPPGCGKTTFAAALAKTLNAHFVAGSYSAWLGTGDGHQGDLLKGMRQAFREAREHAPSVILVDEIDNFIQRGSIGDGKHDEWMRGVVNGLLECLDGAIERPGVIVVGATNDPSGIDAALLRAGRLDRHIAIPLPDAEARLAILAQHLDVDEAFGLGAFKRHTEGMSGADLERLARDARRHARRDGTELRHAHIARAFPRREPRTPAEIRRIATHEVGHAIVAAALGGRLEQVVVHKDRDPSCDGEVAGFAAIEPRDGPHDATWYLDRVAHILGGLAAETIVFGSHSDGVVMDLAEASNMVTYTLTSLGMGDTLLSDGHRDPAAFVSARSYDPVLRRRVEDVLQEQLERAVDILLAHREAFDDLVELLILRGRLDGAVVAETIASCAGRAPAQLSLAV
ncbi:AAA family ATPase [Pararhizobium arenae]|uniref:AAA family ATPase n=1 Tax=Pararhizobium arenae TaxID=1856850 RepID=UPI0009FA9010|nr:AAA family ATPase [Pararhizobium arenae]